MARISVTIIRDTDIDEALRELQRTARPQLRRAAGRIARGPISAEMLRRLVQAPGSPRYPYQWSSERQRRAFFATNGFGRGIPTKRTGQLERAWTVVLGEAGTILAQNPTEYASYVQGDDQQPGHVQTGWENATEVMFEFATQYQDALIGAWFEITERLGL